MRDTNILLQGFNEVRVLYQYLYMHEDNSITINSNLTRDFGDGKKEIVQITITMDENMHFYSTNTLRPNMKPMLYDEHMTLTDIFDIIAQLKEMPAVEHPKQFKTRWNEIITFTGTTAVLNSFNKKR